MDLNAENLSEAHFCIKCQSIIVSLDNYITHRQTAQCRNQPTDAIRSNLEQIQQIFSIDLHKSPLRADDFFSSLQLQSSSKFAAATMARSLQTTGPLTRSKTKDIAESYSGKVIKDVVLASTTRKEYPFDEYYHDDDDLYMSEDEESSFIPPKHHTGGKWKPLTSPVPIEWMEAKEVKEMHSPSHGGKYKMFEFGGKTPVHPSQAGGKWKPLDVSNEHESVGYSLGRWVMEDEVISPNAKGGKFGGKVHEKIEARRRFDYSEDAFKLRSKEDQRGKTIERPERVISPSYTKGKWISGDVHDDRLSPSYTRGKWLPGKQHEEDLKKNQDDIPRKPSKWSDRHFIAIETPQDDFMDQCNLYRTSALMNTPKIIEATKIVKGGKKGEKVGGKNKRVRKRKVFGGRRRVKKKTVKKKSEGKIGEVGKEKDTFVESNTEKKLYCIYCNENFPNKSAYNRHITESNHNLNPTVQDTRFASKKAITKSHRPSKNLIKCAICKMNTPSYLIGKHLISHFHWRRCQMKSTPELVYINQVMILNNIKSIVHQLPFQCRMCKFYCNTHMLFLDHWRSLEHLAKDDQRGYFDCNFCDVQTFTNDGMFNHLQSFGHSEVMSVLNRSLPIVIYKKTPIHCSTCKKTFLYNMQLKKHYRSSLCNISRSITDHYQERKQCGICAMVFFKKKRYQWHMKRKHGEYYFYCGSCSLEFLTVTDAQKHRLSSNHKVLSLTTNKPVTEEREKKMQRKCLHCRKSFTNLIVLKNHLKNDHPDVKYICPHCNAEFLLPQQVSSHIRLNQCKSTNQLTFETTNLTNQEAFKCRLCFFLHFSSKSEAMFHEILHEKPIVVNNIRMFKCSVCGRLHRKAALRCHLRKHTGERPFTCDRCHVGFMNRSALRNHEMLVRCGEWNESGEAEEKFTCGKCGKEFKNKYLLKQHEQIHQPYTHHCPYVNCTHQARSESDLKPHLLTHTAEQQFVCEICQFSTNTRPNLLRHMKTHEVTKAFQCSQCSYSGRLAHHLRRHMRLHTKVKPFKCPHCTYVCNSLDNLRKHVISTKRHVEKWLYKCKFCTSSDRSSMNFCTDSAKIFRAHLIEKHPNQFESSRHAASFNAGIYDVHVESVDFDSGQVVDELPSIGVQQKDVAKRKRKNCQDHKSSAPKPTVQNSTQDIPLKVPIVTTTSTSKTTPLQTNFLSHFQLPHSSHLKLEKINLPVTNVGFHLPIFTTASIVPGPVQPGIPARNDQTIATFTIDTMTGLLAPVTSDSSILITKTDESSEVETISSGPDDFGGLIHMQWGDGNY